MSEIENKMTGEKVEVIELRNRQHLIQLLNGVNLDAKSKGCAQVWYRTKFGYCTTVSASKNKTGNGVTVYMNGARASRDDILRNAGC